MTSPARSRSRLDKLADDPTYYGCLLFVLLALLLAVLAAAGII